MLGGLSDSGGVPEEAVVDAADAALIEHLFLWKKWTNLLMTLNTNLNIFNIEFSWYCGRITMELSIYNIGLMDAVVF